MLKEQAEQGSEGLKLQLVDCARVPVLTVLPLGRSTDLRCDRGPRMDVCPW